MEVFFYILRSWFSASPFSLWKAYTEAVLSTRPSRLPLVLHEAELPAYDTFHGNVLSDRIGAWKALVEWSYDDEGVLLGTSRQKRNSPSLCPKSEELVSVRVHFPLVMKFVLAKIAELFVDGGIKPTQPPFTDRF